MIVPGGRLLPEPRGHHADRHDPHHVADHRNRQRAGEEQPLAPCLPLREVRISRRERHHREQRTDAAARIRHVHIERGSGHPRIERCTRPLDRQPHAVQQTGRDRSGKDAQVDREKIDEGRHRDREAEECRRETHQPLHAAPPEGIRQRPHQADERHLLHARLAAAPAEPSDHQKKRRPRRARPARRARRRPQRAALPPQHRQTDERHHPAMRHVLDRRREHHHREIEHVAIVERRRRRDQRQRRQPHPVAPLRHAHPSPAAGPPSSATPAAAHSRNAARTSTAAAPSCSAN